MLSSATLTGQQCRYEVERLLESISAACRNPTAEPDISKQNIHFAVTGFLSFRFLNGDARTFSTDAVQVGKPDNGIIRTMKSIRQRNYLS